MSFAPLFLQSNSIHWASYSNERKKLEESGSVTLSQSWRGRGEEESKVEKKINCELRENIFIYFS